MRDLGCVQGPFSVAKFGVSASYVVVAFLNHGKEGGERESNSHRESGKGYWLDFKGPLGHTPEHCTAGYLYVLYLPGNQSAVNNHTRHIVAYFPCTIHYNTDVCPACTWTLFWWGMQLVSDSFLYFLLPFYSYYYKIQLLCRVERTTSCDCCSDKIGEMSAAVARGPLALPLYFLGATVITKFTTESSFHFPILPEIEISSARGIQHYHQ